MLLRGGEGQEPVLLQDGLHQHSSGFSLLHSGAAQGVLGQLEESHGDGLRQCRGEVVDEQVRGQVSDLPRQERWGKLGREEGKQPEQSLRKAKAGVFMKLTSLVLSCKQLSSANKLGWEKKSQQPLCLA